MLSMGADVRLRVLVVSAMCGDVLLDEAQTYARLCLVWCSRRVCRLMGVCRQTQSLTFFLAILLSLDMRSRAVTTYVYFFLPSSYGSL